MNVYDRVVPNGALASLVALSIGLLIAVVFDFVLRTGTTAELVDELTAIEIELLAKTLHFFGTRTRPEIGGDVARGQAGENERRG